MIHLTKISPLAVSFIFAVLFVPYAISSFKGYSEEIKVKLEVKEIANLILIHEISGFDRPTTENLPYFAALKRKSNPNEKRDLTHDVWGSPFHIQYVEKDEETTVIVRSPGRDKKYLSNDDIISKKLL